MKNVILSIAAFIGFSMFLVPLATGTIYANPVTDGIDATCAGGDCQQYNDNGEEITVETKANSIVEDVINIFSWIVGVVSVIMVIFGGFRYITSGGDAGKVTSAKNTIVYALVGLVVAALAQVLVLFVLGKVT
mgnify:CR=1 FL=1|jgi:cytochrome bd-type quinol oxidase subunit 2